MTRRSPWPRGCGGASPAPAPKRAAKATTPARLQPGERCPITRRHFVNEQVGYAAGDGRVRYIGLPRDR